MNTTMIDKDVLTEPEINYWYPKEWEKEYRDIGIVQRWRQDYPDLFNGSRGIPLELRPDGTLANFPPTASCIF